MSNKELAQDPLIRYSQLRDDPWKFLKYSVYTQDEVDQDNPIKPYPAYLEYLHFLVHAWQKKKRIAVPKSRRLTVSWTYISLALWDCIFHRGRSWALVSKKEEDSKELIQRAKFIYDHIPPEIISPDLLPKLKHGDMQASPPAMEFEELHSRLMGFPSGKNQLRQRGFSGLFFDEVAFWGSDAEAAYASAEPTVKGGGRMIMVSTRNPGFFKKVVFDQFDAKDLNFPEVPPTKPKQVMEGVDVWENPKNGFTVIDVSHRANPAKRDPIFEEELKRSLPIHLFNLEYGKSWATFEGKPVYEDFNGFYHLANIKPTVEAGLPLLLGWDSSGLTPAVVIGQLQGEQLVIVEEIVGAGMGATRFVPYVAEKIRLNYPQVGSVSETINFFDPAGFKKNEVTEQTYIQAMIKGGFTQVRPGPMTWEKRREAVTERLVGLAHGKSKFLVWELGCPLLVTGFKGGYRYPDKVIEVEPDKVRPIKDVHSHPHDALQYLCGGLKSYRHDGGYTKIPTPHYGFQTQNQRPQLRKRYG